MATFLRSLSAQNVDALISGLQAATGDYVVAIYSHTAISNPQTSAPTFNGQSLPALFTDTTFPSGDTSQRVSIYGGFITSGGAFDLIGSIDAIVDVNMTALVFSAVNTGTPLSALFSVFGWSTWANPALAVTGVAAGDVVIDVLCTMKYDSTYTATTSVWTATQSQTAVSALAQGTNRIDQHIVSRTNPNPRIRFVFAAGAI